MKKSNLKIHELTPEERNRGRETQRQNRKLKQDLRLRAEAWLDASVGFDKEGNELTGADLMIQVAAKEIVEKHNPKFWELMRDTAGQKPVDKVVVAEVEQSVIDEVESLINSYEDK